MTEKYNVYEVFSENTCLLVQENFLPKLRNMMQEMDMPSKIYLTDEFLDRVSPILNNKLKELTRLVSSDYLLRKFPESSHDFLIKLLFWEIALKSKKFFKYITPLKIIKKIFFPQGELPDGLDYTENMCFNNVVGNVFLSGFQEADESLVEYIKKVAKKTDVDFNLITQGLNLTSEELLEALNKENDNIVKNKIAEKSKAFVSDADKVQELVYLGGGLVSCYTKTGNFALCSLLTAGEMAFAKLPSWSFGKTLDTIFSILKPSNIFIGASIAAPLIAMAVKNIKLHFQTKTLIEAVPPVEENYKEDYNDEDFYDEDGDDALNDMDDDDAYECFDVPLGNRGDSNSNSRIARQRGAEMLSKKPSKSRATPALSHQNSAARNRGVMTPFKANLMSRKISKRRADMYVEGSQEVYNFTTRHNLSNDARDELARMARSNIDLRREAELRASTLDNSVQDLRNLVNTNNFIASFSTEIAREIIKYIILLLATKIIDIQTNQENPKFLKV